MRRTAFELGLELELNRLQCVSKILYYADSDERFAEYELDYIIFAKMEEEVPKFVPNADEVKAIEWVGID